MSVIQLLEKENKNLKEKKNLYFILQEKKEDIPNIYLSCTLTMFQSKENLPQKFSEYT